MSLRILRDEARSEVEAIFDYCLAQAGNGVALQFADAIEDATRHLIAHPATGSPLWQERIGLPGLRTWLLSGFPYLVFYVETARGPEVISVVHASRDIPAIWRE